MAKRGIWKYIDADIGSWSLKSLKGTLPMLPMLSHRLPWLPQTTQILKALENGQIKLINLIRYFIQNTQISYVFQFKN